MKSIFFLLLVTLLWLSPAAARTRWANAPTRHESYQGAKGSLASGVRRLLHINPDDRFIDNSPGILAVVSAGFGIAAFIALGLTATTAFLIPIFVGGIVATVAGAVALKRHKPVYAILGLTLGLLEIIGGIIALAILV